MKRALAAAATIVLLALLANLVEWRALGGVFSRAHPAWLAPGCAIVLLFPLLNAARWQAALEAVGVRMGFAECLRVTMAVWPVGTLTPAKAGEFLKALAVRPGGTLGQGVGSALAERVVDVGVLGAFGAAFGLAAGSAPAALAGAAALAAALAAFGLARPLSRRFAAARPGKLAEKLLRLAEALPALARSPGCFARCAGASALNWFLSMLQLWLLLRAFGAPSPLVLVVGVLPAATFAGLLPVTVAGAGTRDAALLALTHGAIDGPALLAAGVVYTLTGYFALGVLGLPQLARLRHRLAAEEHAP
ncbi:MAG: lysylphosphatidylglycerol synthase transmembrane domain-containing protein [Candidatus Sumerlaeia bacterium]|nr:lysylphosphatidylglycerol synthase transmembrane domain-containing protein [Candidatus Sumerlaeia bacterium]